MYKKDSGKFTLESFSIFGKNQVRGNFFILVSDIERLSAKSDKRVEQVSYTISFLTICSLVLCTLYLCME